jgi:hypothetical protein
LRREKFVRDRWFEITIIVELSQQLFTESCVGCGNTDCEA